MAPPLAGKPPFATDEPDSYYEGSPSPAKRRVAPPKPDNPNKRSSAYDVYDNYLAAPGESSSNGQRPSSTISTATSRNSGIGGIGMGLLAMDSDDDDDDDDEAYERKRKAEKEKREREAAAAAAGGQQSKNAALAAAVAGKPTSSSPANSNLNPNAIAPPPTQRSPPPIAAPRPGYAAPAFAQLDSGFGKSPSPVENPFEPASQAQQRPPQQQQGGMPPPPPHMRGGPPGPGGPMHQQPRAPPGINMNMGGGGPRQPPPLHTGGGPMPPPTAIVRGMTPAPLAPPMTPILPVFAVGPKSTPSPSPGPDSKEKGEDGGNVKWDDLPVPIPRKPIMRSNTEDALLPRRGEKGDDFWRRFSMIAKVDMAEKSKGGKGSSWLRRTENGKQRLSRWVWIIGMILLCAIGGAIGLGVYFTRDSPDHQQPAALAGNVGNQTAGAGGATSSVVPIGAGRGGGGGSPSTSRLHVSPTHTIEGRGFVMEVVPTAPAVSVVDLVKERERREHLAVEEHHRRSAQRKRRF
ncbi:hypothetical protein MD484_g5693, partial [Candolleomyces efflorescens]